MYDEILEQKTISNILATVPGNHAMSICAHLTMKANLVNQLAPVGRRVREYFQKQLIQLRGQPLENMLYVGALT